MEALRTVKETAEQPEKEAKERHLTAWEGKLRCERIINCLLFLQRIIFQNDYTLPVFAKFLYATDNY